MVPNNGLNTSFFFSLVNYRLFYSQWFPSVMILHLRVSGISGIWGDQSFPVCLELNQSYHWKPRVLRNLGVLSRPQHFFSANLTYPIPAHLSTPRASHNPELVPVEQLWRIIGKCATGNHLIRWDSAHAMGVTNTTAMRVQPWGPRPGLLHV